MATGSRPSRTGSQPTKRNDDESEHQELLHGKTPQNETARLRIHLNPTGPLIRKSAIPIRLSHYAEGPNERNRENGDAVEGGAKRAERLRLQKNSGRAEASKSEQEAHSLSASGARAS
jgi:hypothetical protein